MPEVGLLDLRRNFATGNDGYGSLSLCVPYMFLFSQLFPHVFFWLYNVSIACYVAHLCSRIQIQCVSRIKYVLHIFVSDDLKIYIC